MNSLDLISMGSRNLFRRKVRTFITVLGVIIGTASIVVMLSLGIGMNESFERELRRMGDLNIITVNRYYYPDDSSGRAGGAKTTVLDDKIVAKISAIDGVEAVTPIVSAYPKLISGKYMAYAQVMGIDYNTMEAFDFKVDKGRLLQEDDTIAAVFGCNVAMQFFKANNRGGGYMVYGISNSNEPPVDVMNDKIEMTFDMSYGEKDLQEPPRGRTTIKLQKYINCRWLGFSSSPTEKKTTIYTWT